MAEPNTPNPNQQSDAAPTKVEAIPDVSLRTGNELSREEADSVVKSAPSVVVAVIGLTGAGKTTLIASLYDRLLEGAIGEYEFVHSRTLVGFEKLCHLARASSGTTVSDTEHTRLSAGLKYYHLGLASGSSQIDLLFADRAGELFLNAATKLEESKELGDLNSCGKYLYLVDGEKFDDSAGRFEVEAKCGLILQALAQVGFLHAGSEIVLVLTKYDLIAPERRAATVARFDELMARMRLRVVRYSLNLQAAVVAARSDVDNVPSGYGIERLVRDFLARTDVRAEPESRVVGTRMFHRIEIL